MDVKKRYFQTFSTADHSFFSLYDIIVARQYNNLRPVVSKPGRTNQGQEEDGAVSRNKTLFSGS